VEQLWRRFNPTGPGLKPSEAGGSNFAVVGATTGSASVLDVDPAFPASLRPFYANTGGASQLQQALAASSSDPDPNSSLYVVWLGANDGLYWFYTGGSPLGSLGSNTGSVLGAPPQPGQNAAESVGNAVKNVVTAVGSLIANGAKKILVPNLLDFGKSPLYNTDPLSSAAVTQLTLGFNSGLSNSLKSLRAANPGVDIMEFDTFSLFNNVRANPTVYGFDNASTRCVQANQTLDPACNPDRWFFWDRTHPTTAAHALISEGMYAVVNEASSPQSVPGPLPVAGAAAAFAFSRRLRRRLLRR
jgi:phospholipase/lecithinase/hemolysin